MATGIIHAGVCGFTINVKAVSDEDNKVQLEITSDCPNYQKVAKELTEVDAYKEILINRIWVEFMKCLRNIALIPVALAFQGY